jgi:hypothetical protein
VNGCLSLPYQVTRGVRQGGPLSCLLFDLAIEPLVYMFRAEKRLDGFTVPYLSQKLIVNLFADNTIIYLHEGDSYDHLWDILNKWCDTSGAKFNKNKTEIVPMGAKRLPLIGVINKNHSRRRSTDS